MGCKEIGNNFYTWQNFDKNNSKIALAIPIVGNESIIDYVRSKINEINRAKESVLGLYRSFNVRFRNGSGGSTIDAERGTRGSDDRLSDAARSKRQADLDGRRNTGESYRDTQIGEINYSLSLMGTTLGGTVLVSFC